MAGMVDKKGRVLGVLSFFLLNLHCVSILRDS